MLAPAIAATHTVDSLMAKDNRSLSRLENP
jgi:hypothetical protein